MKIKLTFILLLFYISVFTQSVPDTETFKLSEVTAITGGSTLTEAFTNSTDSYFDAAYKGSKDRLLNFRNYTVSAGTIPTVTTTAISNIGDNHATSGGNVTDDGGSTVTARGVCWNTTGTPTTSDFTTSDGTGVGTYISSMTSLICGDTYYVRAYAINSTGTAYGSELSFTATTTGYPAYTLFYSITNGCLSGTKTFINTFAEAQTACEDVSTSCYDQLTGTGYKIESLTVGMQVYNVSACQNAGMTGYYLAAGNIVYILSGTIQSITACP